MNPVNPWAELLRLLREHSDTAPFPLDRAALLLVADAHPGLRIRGYEAVLEGYAGQVRAAVSEESGADPRRRLGALRRVLFEEAAFHGNVEDYYDPRNSYLNEVLDRKLGIPITLAAVVVGVSRRLEWPLRPVNFPAHVLLRYDAPGEPLAVDPFHGGLILGPEELRERWLLAAGTDPPPVPDMLRPAEPRALVARMLNNLRITYHARGEVSRVERLEARMVEVMRGSA